MFIERYVELDIDKVKRSIPLYCENKLSYFRREKSGNYTFMIKDGFTHEYNPLKKFVMKLLIATLM